METIQQPRGGAKEAVAAEVRASLAREKIPTSRLAEMIGRSQSYWDRRVNGHIPFDVEELESVARVTGAKVRSFFTDKQFGFCVAQIRPIGRRLTGNIRPILLSRAA